MVDVSDWRLSSYFMSYVQVFLTWRAIYLLVFDLSRDLDEKAGDGDLLSYEVASIVTGVMKSM